MGLKIAIPSNLLSLAKLQHITQWASVTPYGGDTRHELPSMFARAYSKNLLHLVHITQHMCLQGQSIQHVCVCVCVPTTTQEALVPHVSNVGHAAK